MEDGGLEGVQVYRSIDTTTGVRGLQQHPCSFLRVCMHSCTQAPGYAPGDTWESAYKLIINQPHSSSSTYIAYLHIEAGRILCVCLPALRFFDPVLLCKTSCLLYLKVCTYYPSMPVLRDMPQQWCIAERGWSGCECCQGKRSAYHSTAYELPFCHRHELCMNE